MSLGQTVKMIRKNKGMTQSQVVEGLFDRSYLSLIESGKLVPPMEKIQAIAERLDVPVSQLIPNHRYVEIQKLASELLSEAEESGNEDTFRQAWNTFAKIKDTDRMKECLLKWSETASASPKLAESIRHTIFLAQVMGEEMTDKWELPIQLGNTYFKLSNFQGAVWTYKDILNQMPPTEIKQRVTSNIGSALMLLMKFEKALDCFGELLKQVDVPAVLLAKAHFGYAECSRNLGLWERAFQHTQIAATMFGRLNDERYMNTQHALGALYLDRKEFDKADQCFERALKYYEDNNRSDDKAHLFEEFARRDFYKCAYTSANEWCDKCLDIVSGVNAQLAGRIFVWKSWIHEMTGNEQGTRDSFRAAVSLLGRDNLHEKIRYIDVNKEVQKRR